MKRLLATTFATVAVAAAVLASLGAGGETSGDAKYVVELDNAFGLIEGADVKVAGVRAGKIESFEVDEKSYRALVNISIGEKGFGDLRKDVFCEARPQSLIGEYFLDCLPGTSPEKLPRGSRIPVAQTGSTIPVDLVNNIMRRPIRERFSILLGELGAALAGRGDDLNETIRRANPALRETDKVLAALAEQRVVIRELTTNAERVVSELADKREDVSRFVREARDTSTASAERHDELQAQFQTFPTFLRELRPTMKLLGEAADRQRPALQNLSDNAPLLREFFDLLGPFSEASRPAFRTLAGAAKTGRRAVKASTPRIGELRVFAELLPEVATNLAMTLEHLDDRAFAVEKDPRSPGGQGFTGFEAILQYIFRQSQATNVFDANTYLLKVSAFLDNNCAQYADVAAAKDPAKQYCRATLGPSQPGIDQPDPSAPAKRRKARRGEPEATATPAPTAESRPESGPEKPSRPLPDLNLPPAVQQLLDDLVEGKPLPNLNTGDLGLQQSAELLDFLLGA